MTFLTFRKKNRFFDETARFVFFALPATLPDAPKAESEAFKDTVSLDYTGLEGKVIIDNTKGLGTLSDAVLKIINESLKNLKRAPAGSPQSAQYSAIRREKLTYMNAITSRLLTAASSKVINGDKVDMKDNKITISHQNKDRTWSSYEVDLNQAPNKIAEEAVKTSTLDRSRQSMEMLRKEIDKENEKLLGMFPRDVQKGLEYIRIFKTGSIQTIMEALGMDGSQTAREQYWKNEMRKSEQYAMSEKQNTEMIGHLKKAVFAKLGLTPAKVLDLAKDEIKISFTTVKGNLKDRFGTRNEPLPASRAVLDNEQIIKKTIEFIDKSGLPAGDIASLKTELTQAVDAALNDVMSGSKIPALDTRFGAYILHTDPLEADANALKAQLALITDPALIRSLEGKIDAVLDKHRIRIAEKYRDDAKTAITAAPNDAKSLADYEAMPEVHEALNAILKIDNRKTVERNALQDEIMNAIADKMVIVASNKVAAAKIVVGAVTDIQDFNTYNLEPEVADALNAIDYLDGMGRDSDKNRLSGELIEAIDQKMIDIAADAVNTAKPVINRVTTIQNFPTYQLMPAVADALKAINFIDARKATEKDALLNHLSDTIDNHMINDIAQSKVNTAIVSGGPIDRVIVVQDKFAYLAITEVTEANNAINVVRTPEKDADRDRLKAQLESAIDNQMVKVAKNAVTDAINTEINSINDVQDFAYYTTLPKHANASTAINFIDSTTRSSDKVSEATRLQTAVDNNMEAVATDKVAAIMPTIATITDFKQLVTAYEALSDVITAKGAISKLDSIRKATEKTSLTGVLDAAIDDQMALNIKNYLAPSSTFMRELAVLEAAGTLPGDGRAPVGNTVNTYKASVSELTEVDTAIRALRRSTDQAFLTTTFDTLIENYI